ncbi:uncharacterized protein LY79DRAFT_574018 [Colletotrichum navitas]|uniref:Uncharacterized protein n=1 Tax=Colletotrichum navitas TaxID=681940 RepID=A0AAD8PJ46_9PEZI|nr:uncharacterized protein LY79DRAFT_574018 [Colletotrichum navitas]KAK1561640.1 hypothetical protein LY79DRAFT_574018 [Colletotrichum navitas]
MKRAQGDATTAVPPPKSSPQTAPRRAARLYPALSLLSIIFLFLSSATGITLSAIVLYHNLESAEVLDPLSRAVFFVASCISLVYVFTHIVAARIAYVKSVDSATVHGKYVSGFAFLLARLGLPVWAAAITLAIFVAVNVGLDLSKGVKDNVPWLNVIISIASFFSLAAVLVVIEMANRPFATLGFSQSWFIREDDTSAYFKNDDLEPSKVEAAASFCGKREKICERNESPEKQERMKRKTLTKTNHREAQQRVVRHARTMSMPTPLRTVFGDQSRVCMPDSPSLHSAFAWRPPTRAGSTLKAEETEPIHNWVTWQEHGNIRQAASDISTDASARLNEVILPSLVLHKDYSPRRQSPLEEQTEYDLRRWAAIGVQSPPFNGGFPIAFFQRPLTPLMTMEEENRIMSSGPLTSNSDWEISQHPRTMQDNRPARSHAIAMSISPRVNSTTEKEHVAPFASTTTVSEEPASGLRSDNGVLPNEGRRRRRISSDGVDEGRHLTYRTESQRDSYHTLQLSKRRPGRHHPTWDRYLPAQRPISPTPTAESVRSNIYNFSRPRTSAAARMQIKVARRLRDVKQQNSRLSAHHLADEQMPTPPSTPGSPGTPRTIRAAAVRNLQDKIERRTQAEQQEIYRRPPSPETPRTARATAVKTLQEGIGKRMLRQNGAEAREIAP